MKAAQEDPARSAITFVVRSESGEVGSGVFNLNDLLEACRDVTHHPLDMKTSSGETIGQLYLSIVAYEALNDILFME